MIVAMKKATVLVSSREVTQALKALRSLGVLHVEHQKLPQGKDINRLQDDLMLCQEALVILAQEPDFKTQIHKAAIKQDSLALARQILDLKKQSVQLDEELRLLQGKINQWQHWGDFDPQQIRRLKDKGVFIKLYQLPVGQLKQFPADLVVERIAVSGGIANVLVAAGHDFSLEAKDRELPAAGLAQMQKDLAEKISQVSALNDQLRQLLPNYTLLLEASQLLAKELEFYQALNGMAEEGSVAYIRGYIPFDSANALVENAHKQGWGILLEEPGQDDNVPTLIRNPAWIAIIRPVFKLLEIIPGYRELDAGPAFLVFFSLFFGILIGDAGYGLVYLLLTFFLQKKIGRKAADQAVFRLFYVLSSCAIIWGLLTGSFFGQAWVTNFGLKPLAPALNDPKFMQTFCFFIGALHLTLAHSWRAVLKLPSLSALMDIGWIAVLWSAFFFARMLILGDKLPGFVLWLLYCGMALVVLFTNPQKNMLKGAGQGLGNLALSLMNNFTDVVSYVRLFAVGMASLAIAETCNTMASGLGKGVLFVAAGILIALVGHGLNLVLGPMSVLVHGVRLNVLEFSGHASLGWAGFAYKPLKE